MSNTPAIAIGLTVGLVALVFVSFLLFFIRRKMLKGNRRKVLPFEAMGSLSKSAKSSSSSLRTTPPISQKSYSDPSSEKKPPKRKKDRSPSPGHLVLQAESMTATPTQKAVYPRLTPSDSSGPPIGDASPRSSLDIQPPASPRRSPTYPSQSHQSLTLLEGGSTTEIPYDMPRPPPPLSESPPQSPETRASRSIDRGSGFAPNEDNPGPYTTTTSPSSQRRGLSRSSRQRSPMRGRGGRSSSSNS